MILAHVMSALEEKMDVGVSGIEVDVLAEKIIRDHGCKPAFKGFDAGAGDPFPATVCFSLNEQIVHAIPSERKIADGDLVKIDIGLIHNGYYADMARTFCMGAVSKEAKHLTETTKKAFFKGLATIKDGSTLHDYAHAVQDYAESEGFHVVYDLVGHGVGKQLHEPPLIPNYVNDHVQNFSFCAGMTVALEPMINIGTAATTIADDGWTYVTGDGSLSAHWENTILVTKNGTEILTKI